MSAPATITDVLDRLDEVVHWARTEGHRAGYFATLYRKVTDRVREGIEVGRFDDGSRMERLDVLFAKRYLEAVERYRVGEVPTRSWEVAFHGAESWSPVILQHLLLGINAHINLDLGIAAAETAPGSALAGLRRDFDEITSLLGEMLDDVQDGISRVSPWMWIVDAVGERRDEEAFSFVLARAREFAWRAAETLAAATPDQRFVEIAVLDRAVAAIGGRIRRPGLPVRMALMAVRAREPNDAAEVIDALAR